MPFSYQNDVGPHLSVYQLANDVLRAAYDNPVLARPEICPIINVDTLHIKQPSLGRLHVNMGVREYESIGIQTPMASSKTVELLNDRIAIQVSAEAQIENYYGDCISMIAEDQGAALAEALEIWIALGMQDQPLRIEADADVVEDEPQRTYANAMDMWHHHVVPHTIQLLDHYAPTAVAMNPTLWAHLQPIFIGINNTSGQPYEQAKTIPGFDAPVALSPSLPMNKIYVISAKASPLRCYQYEKMTPVIDYDPVINADAMYTGIWRTVAGNFRQAKKPTWDDDGEKKDEKQTGNAGIVEITLAGGFFGLQGDKAYKFAGSASENNPDPSDKDAIEEYITRENAAILANIIDFGGEYIKRQLRIANATKSANPTIDDMAQKFGLTI